MVGFASILDAAATRNLIAYLQTLPDPRPEQSVSGDASAGARLYDTCAGCHGVDGQGIWTSNGPRLANLGDWYLERQLKYFKQGVRGKHPQDFHGAQMALLMGTLRDDRAIADVVAYINTLGSGPAMAAAGTAAR